MSPNLEPCHLVENITAVLQKKAPVVVLLSGGVDSLTLAAMAHRVLKDKMTALHATAPFVPLEDTRRTLELAKSLGFHLQKISRSSLLENKDFNINSLERCYICKKELLTTALRFTEKPSHQRWDREAFLAGGENLSDLNEDRPGFRALQEIENRVSLPFIEARMNKEDIRLLARHLGLSFANLPSSPCLATRIYSGTLITRDRLNAVSFAESFLKQRNRLETLRCRIKENCMLIEISSSDHLEQTSLERLRSQLVRKFPFIETVDVDPRGYRHGQASR